MSSASPTSSSPPGPTSPKPEIRTSRATCRGRGSSTRKVRRYTCLKTYRRYRRSRTRNSAPTTIATFGIASLSTSPDRGRHEENLHSPILTRYTSGSSQGRRSLMSAKNLLTATSVSRRDMLRLGAGGLGFGLFGGIGHVPPVLSQASYSVAAKQSGKILIVFEWFGGNDGLNTIVPYGDPLYYKHRPTIGIKEPDVLKIDAQFGWYKSMRGMKRLYDEGKVAIVQGVGYDQPSFSHFTSMSFWHTAAPNSGNEYGWIGRTASALDPGGARANMIVNISDSQSLAVKAEKHVPLVFSEPEKFQRGVF